MSAKKGRVQSTKRPDIVLSRQMTAPSAPIISQNVKSTGGMLTAPKNLQDHISLRTKYLERLLHQNHRSEVQAAHVMKQLTTKFGTRGRSVKKIFLQAFENDIRNSSEKDCSCVTEEEKERLRQATVERKKGAEETGSGKATPSFMDRERPAAIVGQSTYVRYLLDVVQNEIHRVGCPTPCLDREKRLETDRIDYVKMSSDFQKGHHYNLLEIARDETKEDIIVESEEKLIARLKIYSRAFSSVILRFKALRPILLDIKRNYDSVLAMKDQQMVEMRVVKKSIMYKEKSMEDHMEEFKFECYDEMAEMEKQSYRLMRHIEKQDAAIITMTDILNRLETTLSETHELRRDADDQKKMLTDEVNVYRKKLGMILRTDDGEQFGFFAQEVVITDEVVEEEDALSTEDPLILRVALLTCKKNLNEIQARLVVLEAEYEAVIPRRQFEGMKIDIGELENAHEALIETYNVLHSQVQTLKDQIEKLTSEREDNQVKIEGLRGKFTPRPSWTKVGEFMEGGVPFWTKVTDGKSSAAIKDKLIEELTTKKISGPPEFLTALGMNSKVKFLRCDNRVRDRHLPRRDAAMVIHDIWQVRMKELDILPKYRKRSEEDGEVANVDFSSESTPIRPFSDFLVTYFTERYPLLALRMEWSYNLVDACKRFTMDRRLTQFMRIVDEIQDENAYHQFTYEIIRLQSLLFRKSADEKQEPGFLPRPMFAEVLREAFPNKTDESLTSLLKAASKQTKAHSDWSTIDYRGFFLIGDEGIVGRFADELATQYDNDRLSYSREIIVQLAAVLGVPIQAAEEDSSGDAAVNMQQFYKAITSVDPNISEEKVGSALAWVFVGVSVLPGLERNAILLLNYVKSKIFTRTNEEDPDASQLSKSDSDDEIFERAIKAITSEDDSQDDTHLSSQQKHQNMKKLKITNLRNVVKRLKGAALLRSGEKEVDLSNDYQGKQAEDDLLESEIGLSPSGELSTIDPDTNA